MNELIQHLFFFDTALIKYENPKQISCTLILISLMTDIYLCHVITPEPLYNMAHYNTVLDITQRRIGPQKTI